jgi:hypothetical protein
MTHIGGNFMRGIDCDCAHSRTLKTLPWSWFREWSWYILRENRKIFYFRSESIHLGVMNRLRTFSKHEKIILTLNQGMELVYGRKRMRLYALEMYAIDFPHKITPIWVIFSKKISDPKIFSGPKNALFYSPCIYTWSSPATIFKKNTRHNNKYIAKSFN